jgi:hypothetical protein
VQNGLLKRNIILKDSQKRNHLQIPVRLYMPPLAGKQKIQGVYIKMSPMLRDSERIMMKFKNKIVVTKILSHR